MQLTNDALNHRTVAEIQRKVVDQGKRNLFSRLFHARDDQGKITAWGLELDRILRVFNVRRVAFTRLSLTIMFLGRVGHKYPRDCFWDPQ